LEIIAVSNIKGGVGKTTTIVNLAYLSARQGWPTVIWDLDPQGAATWTLRAESQRDGSAKQLVRGERELPELICNTAYENLDIIPADFSYRKFDVRLARRKRPVERLLRMSRPLQATCATLFLDCPPGMSLLSESVLRAADVLVVPILPTPFSLRTLEQLYEFIARQGWADMLVLPFFSMVDRRKALHAQLITDARARWPSILATEVPYWSDIERMSVRRAPLPAFAPGSPATRVYEALWNELDDRVHAARNPASVTA
jgi:cellulose biosynthesis protein BcsQ